MRIEEKITEEIFFSCGKLVQNFFPNSKYFFARTFAHILMKFSNFTAMNFLNA